MSMLRDRFICERVYRGEKFQVYWDAGSGMFYTDTGLGCRESASFDGVLTITTKAIDKYKEMRYETGPSFDPLIAY